MHISSLETQLDIKIYNLYFSPQLINRLISNPKSYSPLLSLKYLVLAPDLHHQGGDLPHSGSTLPTRSFPSPSVTSLSPSFPFYFFQTKRELSLSLISSPYPAQSPPLFALSLLSSGPSSPLLLSKTHETNPSPLFFSLLLCSELTPQPTFSFSNPKRYQATDPNATVGASCTTLYSASLLDPAHHTSEGDAYNPSLEPPHLCLLSGPTRARPKADILAELPPWCSFATLIGPSKVRKLRSNLKKKIKKMKKNSLLCHNNIQNYFKMYTTK
jgi:hypothetical protein